MANVHSEETQLTMVAAGATTATTAVNGATVDMAGYEGVLLFARIVTANAGNFLKAQQGDASDGSDAQDLAGSKCLTDDTDDIAIIDVNRPKDRYVRGVIVRAGATTVTGDMYALRYNANNRPTVNTIANLQRLVRLNSPAEGTP